MDEKTVMSRLERLELREGKLREKKRRIEAQLREIESKKRAIKELEIKRMIKAFKIPHDKLYDFLKSGAVPSQTVKPNIDEREGYDDEEA